jgi:hypothetical protein
MSAARTNSTGRRLDPAVAVFAVVAAVSAVVLLTWLGELTFWRDEWGFLLQRRGSDPDVFLEPHYEHIAVSLIALYKGMLEIFGMDSPRPFQVVAVASFMGSLVLVFVYVRRRVGGWAALAGVLPLMLFGPSWDDVLWPFQIGFFGSMCAGLGALLLLERDDRGSDVAACVLLAVSLSFSSLGIPFAIGVALAVALGPEPRRRAFVAAIPIVLYALWWLGYGRHADNYTSLHNAATGPSYVLDGFASSISSLLGLATPTSVVGSPLDWGRGLLVAAVALAIWRLRRAGRLERGLLVILAIAVSFWFLAAFNASIFREPTSGRYQYMGAIFVVLIAAELLRGVRVGRGAAVALVAVAAMAALSNANSLHTTWERLTPFGELQPAGLAALELTRDVVDPDLELTEENSGVDYLGFVDAGAYLSAVDAFGSPAYTPVELADAPEAAREAADRVFATALELELSPAAGARDTGCAAVGLGREARPAPVGTGGVTIEAPSAGPVQVRARRYASEGFPVDLGHIEAGRRAVLAIPADRSQQPWELGLAGAGTAYVCGVGP